MSSKEKEKNNKIKAKLSGHGIDGSWLNKAKSYMEENGYGINQISTKVVPYIQEEIKLVEEREFLKRKKIELKEKERKDVVIPHPSINLFYLSVYLHLFYLSIHPIYLSVFLCIYLFMPMCMYMYLCRGRSSSRGTPSWSASLGWRAR